MKRMPGVLALVFLLSGAVPARAATIPYFNVNSFGIELCPQYICGAAYFTGLFFGQVGNNPWGLGALTVAVTHEDLPTADHTIANILGGQFEIRVGLRKIRGIVTGGELEYQPDNTFLIRVVLQPLEGPPLGFSGVLNHNTFPPTVTGHMQTLGS